jgi:hypothetical protein
MSDVYWGFLGRLEKFEQKFFLGYFVYIYGVFRHVFYMWWSHILCQLQNSEVGTFTEMANGIRGGKFAQRSHGDSNWRQRVLFAIAQNSSRQDRIAIDRVRAQEHEKRKHVRKKQLLRRRNLVERVIGKLKRHIGDSFSRFRAWGAAVQATITLGILTLIYGLLNFATGIYIIATH